MCVCGRWGRGVGGVSGAPVTSAVGSGKSLAAKGPEEWVRVWAEESPDPLAGLECQVANPSLKQLANFHACSGIPLKFPNKPSPGPSLACTWSKFGSRSRGSPRHTCHFSPTLSVRPSFPGPEHPHCRPSAGRHTSPPRYPPPGPPLGRSPSSPPSCCCRPYP